MAERGRCKGRLRMPGEQCSINHGNESGTRLPHLKIGGGEVRHGCRHGGLDPLKQTKKLLRVPTGTAFGTVCRIVKLGPWIHQRWGCAWSHRGSKPHPSFTGSADDSYTHGDIFLK